jgi:putative transposase
MEIKRCLKIRLYPTLDQFQQFIKTCGCRRFIYNKYVESREQFYKNNIKGRYLTKEQKKEIYKQFKYKTEKELKEEYSFLKEVSSVALQQGRKDAEKAYKDFFKGKKGKPHFQKRKDGSSFREVMLPKELLSEHEQWIQIPVIGKVSFKHNHIPVWFHTKGIKRKNITVEVSKSGRCYCSICCEYESISDKERIYSNNDNQIIGLDFSPLNAYIDSNGNKAPNYVPFKQEAKKHLAHLQRNFSRTKKGSNNREKARRRLAKFEEHIANKRRDWMEKETLRLVRSYEVIGVETLNIKGMMKFSRNAKNYNDVSWCKFTSMLEWKSKFHNCLVVKADKFFASSQLCNKCGFKNKEVKNLSVRNWICPQCGEIHNRDQNASINLKKNALREVNKIKSTVGTIGTYACGGQGSKASFASNVDCSLNQEERFVRTFIEANRL